MRLIRSLDFWMNVVWWNELQFMTLFYVFDKGSSFLLVCCLLIWNMDCLLSKDPVFKPILHARVNSIFFFIFYVVLSGDIDCLCRSKDRVLHILHALAYSMCLIGSLRLVVLCLKMLPGDMDWLSSKGRVCYKSCMRGCIPPYVSVSHVWVCPMCVCVRSGGIH